VRTDLELRHLRVFVSVVETGAHTRAARALGVSQSTVSETLSGLERALGTALFRKAGKGSMLTPSGETLLPYARRMIALSGELVVELAKVSSHVSGTLAVAAVESLSAYVLPRRLAALRERWPKARLEVITGACHEIRESVTAGKCDLGLVLEADTGATDDSILARGRLVIFGAPSHPLASRRVTPDELPRGDIFMSDAGGDYHQILRQYFEAAHVPVPRTQALGTLEGVKRGILAGGAALGLLPMHAVAQELEDGTLAEVVMTPPMAGLVMRAVFPSGNAGSPIIDDLIASLRDSLMGD
jgi:DNA-binding transcriptional LysR family regulator